MPRSDVLTGADREDDYTNCYYACRFCNGARSTRLIVDVEGRRLLDPCANAWSHHFARVGHELKPVKGDRDAEYTHTAYDLDDPRKVQLRLERESVLKEAKRVLAEVVPLLDRLADDALQRPHSDTVVAMRELHQHLSGARADLQRFAPLPLDAPEACRCGRPELCTLPAHIATQTIAL